MALGELDTGDNEESLLRSDDRAGLKSRGRTWERASGDKRERGGGANSVEAGSVGCTCSVFL